MYVATNKKGDAAVTGINVSRGLRMAVGVAMLAGMGSMAGYAQETADEGMALIPAGVFEMGDALNEGRPSERPLRQIDVPAFMIDRHPVTWTEWRVVHQWAVENGYSFDHPGAGQADDHPVQSISWFDAVKWSNARSEMEGLVPCYYTSDDFTETRIYRTGRVAMQSDWVRWDATGYRLPTEIEWEKAARGGAEGRRFPWQVNEITHSRANYFSWQGYDYDLGPDRGYHPMHDEGSYPKTNAVDEFEPNEYGVKGMAGNVWEWCWDWYDEEAYTLDPETNPYGPEEGTMRVRRGGSWLTNAWHARVALRFGYEPDESRGTLGFRNVRRAQ